MNSFRGYAETDRGEVGANINSLQKQVDALKQGLTAVTAVTVSIPEIDTSFTPLYDRTDKRGVYVTLAFFIPGDTQDLKIVMVERSVITDATTFGQKRIKKGLENSIEDTHRAAGRIEDRIDVRLKYNTVYDIIRLISIGSEGSRHTNPESDPTYTGVGTPPYDFLYSFTTPDRFDVPSSPALALIKSNALDLKTREHDAYVVLRVWAPLTTGGAAQTWAACGMDALTVVLRRDDVTPTVHIKKQIQITSTDTLVDSASTPVINRGYIDVLFDNLRVGGDYSWLKNVGYTNGDAKESTGAAVTFVGGNLAVNPATLTGLSLTVQATDPFDGKHRFLVLNLTQPALVVALKHTTIRIKEFGLPDSAYGSPPRVKKFSLRDDEWHTAGAKNIPIKTVKLKPNKSYTLETTVTALGGLQVVFLTHVGTGVSDEVDNDTTAPANLPTPIFKFAAGLFAKMSMAAVTQVNTLVSVEININDGTNSLNIDDPTSDTVIAGTTTFYQLAKGPKVTLDIRKKRLKKMFGPTAQLRVKFRLTNLIGSTTSPDSAVISIGDAVDIAPSLNDNNKLWNGHFTRLESAGTLANWQAYKPSDGTFSIVDTGTGKLRYQDAEHRVKWHQNPVSDIDSNKRWLVQHIGDVIRGDFYALTFRVVADGNRTVDFDIGLATIIGAGVTFENYQANGVTKGPINMTATLSGNIVQDVETSFRLATDADVSGNTFFVVRLNSRVDSSLADPFVFADEFMLVSGLTTLPYSERLLREGVRSSLTEFGGPVATSSSYTTGEEFGATATLVSGGIYERMDGSPEIGIGRIYTY